jgi:hypothetical protein
MKCNDCGIKIPAKRLRAIADAEYCVDCAPQHTKRVREHEVAYAMAVPSELDGEANGMALLAGYCWSRFL